MKELLIALQLARVIAGEAPNDCSLEAKLAVPWVVNNRVQQGVVQEWYEGWYGDADPEPIDLAVALIWRNFPDPTDGAIHLLGPGDRAKTPWLSNTRPKRQWRCLGTFLEAY